MEIVISCWCSGLVCRSSGYVGYSSVLSFGDGLSDNGNVARFTDGAVWVLSYWQITSWNLLSILPMAGLPPVMTIRLYDLSYRAPMAG